MQQQETADERPTLVFSEDWPSQIFRDKIIYEIEKVLNKTIEIGSEDFSLFTDAYQIENDIFQNCKSKNEYLLTLKTVFNVLYISKKYALITSRSSTALDGTTPSIVSSELVGSETTTMTTTDLKEHNGPDDFLTKFINEFFNKSQIIKRVFEITTYEYMFNKCAEKYGEPNKSLEFWKDLLEDIIPTTASSSSSSSSNKNINIQGNPETRMIAVNPSAMNLKMRLEPHNKSPFDSQNVLSHMSAPDLSFWSQMEGTSLFCNSAAFAAAAASEAAVNMSNSTNMPHNLFNPSAAGGFVDHPSFHSLAHLPNFNLNSLTTNANNNSGVDINPFDSTPSIQGGGGHQTSNNITSRQQPPPLQQQPPQIPQVGQPQQQQHPLHHSNNFWASHTNSSNITPTANSNSSISPPQTHSHPDSIMGSFNPASAAGISQKLSSSSSVDFRTVSLPTSDENNKQRSPSNYCINPVIPVSNAIMCQVCLSAPSNGLHFGAKVCAACAAFFRRSVSDAKKYICKRSQRCLLRVNDQTGYRKICRDCRFKRCLEIGMLPENVQHKRHRRDADQTPPIQLQLQQQQQLHPPQHHGSLLGGTASNLNNPGTIGGGLHHGDYLDLFQQHAVAAAAAAAQQQQQQHPSQNISNGPSPSINFNMSLTH